MAKHSKGQGVDRLLNRGASRSPAIGIDQLPRAVQRIAEREDGLSLSSASSNVSVSAPKPASTPKHQGGPDMRSELVRKVVEMAQLQRSQELVQANRAKKAPAKASQEDSAAGANLEAWCAEI